MQAWLEVDLGVVRNNYQIIRQRVGRTIDIIGVVKSNAYGHGIEKIAETLDRTDLQMFAVISIEEARRVRSVSGKTVLILGYLDTKEVVDAIEEGYCVSLYDVEQIPLYQRIAERLGRNISVQLKVETGLNRLGMQPQEAIDFLLSQHRYPNISVEAIFSHLAAAADPVKSATQLRALQDLIIDLEGRAPLLPVHLNSSYALGAFSQGNFDAVRVGLALYGVDTVLPGLEPSLTCKATVMQVKPVAQGEGISYGHLYTAKRNMSVAVISIGYADGLSVVLRDAMTVLIRGREVPVVGQICMNMIIADVTGLQVKRGDEAVIIGSQKDENGRVATIRVADLAKRSQLRHHEIITRLGIALPKRYFGGGI